MSFNNKSILKHKKISYNSEVIPWLKEGELLKHPLINLVRDIKSKAKPSDLLSVKEANKGNFKLNNKELKNILKPRNIHQRKHIMDKFKDKVPSFSKRLRINKEELKEKERHANILKISK
jgi:hypothetical protein